MISNHQIQQLIDLPIEGVAERLGFRVSRHFCLCPFHEDRHPSLHFNVQKNRFQCYVCGEYGRTIDLVMKHLHLSFADACKWLADGSNIILEAYQTKQSLYPHTSASKPFDAAKYSRFFDRPFLNASARQFLFCERKLNPQVISWCRLTSWQSKEGISWLQIPYYDIDNHLIGVQWRNLDYSKSSAINHQSSPRFRFPRGSKCSIYNLPVLKLLREGEPLFITEGASDCWSMLSSGHKAIAIPSATLLNAEHLKLLETCHQELGTIFHMFPDNDEPGERLFLQLRDLLPQIVRHQLPAGCKDFSEAYVKKLKS